MPPLAILPALIAGAGTVGGLVEGAQAGNRQQKALTEQEQIAQQEMADKQQIFKQLVPFFSQYLGAGSPFLSQIQRASAETTATGANNAAGMVRGATERSGLGFGPSGAEAAALGGLGAETAKTSSSNYLTNLLNNEQIKFQAAQGLNAAGQMAGAAQNQPNVSAQLPYQSLGSGLSGLSQFLAGITGSGANQVPDTSSIPSNTGSIIGAGLGTPPPIPTFPVSPSGAPTTQGWMM